MQDLIEEFLNYLKIQKNYSINTITNYQRDLLLFYEYLEKESLSFNNLEYQDIRLFYSYMDSKNYNKSTICRILSSIRSFYKYLSRNNYVKSNIFKYATNPKKDKLLPKFLYEDQLEELFSIPDLTTTLGIRDRLILELLYSTGVRVSELVSLKVNDFNYDDMSIKVLGKGNKERIVYFDDYTLEYLNMYLSKRYQLLKDKEDTNYLLLNKNGTSLTDRGVRLIIDNIMKKSTINEKISPHVIRHTFATNLLNEGCDITTVQELLGHESLRATQVYTHITNEKLKQVYENSHPRNIKE